MSRVFEYYSRGCTDENDDDDAIDDDDDVIDDDDDVIDDDAPWRGSCFGLDDPPPIFSLLLFSLSADKEM